MFSKFTMNKSALSNAIRGRAFLHSGALRQPNTGLRFSSTRHGNDPEVLQREKERNLSSKSQNKTSPHEHAPGWNEHLASDSEASVKADRSTHASGEQLQNDTVNHLQSRHEEDGANFSTDDKESMSGPLSSAGPGEAKKENVKRTTSETR
ncbi:hypothetical protein C8J56DRAFT_356869 [Mycena floridula]|nr:hypothetical protein C8J56DRAFT_356869 [Mycena floridula]